MRLAGGGWRPRSVRFTDACVRMAWIDIGWSLTSLLPVRGWTHCWARCDKHSMDKPAAAKDWEAFMVAHASATSLVDDFFGYLKSASDIPDEL